MDGGEPVRCQRVLLGFDRLSWTRCPVPHGHGNTAHFGGDPRSTSCLRGMSPGKSPRKFKRTT